jgi:hypothetical protein
VHKKNSNSFFLVFLILGVLFRGLLGAFSVQAVGDPSKGLLPFAQSDSTVTATSTFTPLPSVTLTASLVPGFFSPFSPGVKVYAFVQAPVGTVSRPYVVLNAFASINRAESVFLRGYVNSQEFICTETPCAVDLDGSSRLVFRAYTSTGESSDEVIASVNVTSDPNGYLVAIDSVSQFTSFVDSCSVAWGLQDEENARWDSFVQFPYQLNTKRTLHTLARNLILNGIVDASSCEYGGLSIGLDWPTGCGLELSSRTMIDWQNQFDEYIWLASKDQGVPPKILKSLIQLESQFWPGNSRFYLDEIGLGQINQLGVDVLLRNDPSVYQRVCPTVLASCSTPYVSLEPSQQALVRGALIQSVDATCPGCQYGLDFDKAKDSISLIASLLRANCQQVDTILNIPYKPDEDVDAATATAAVATVAAGGTLPGADYEDYWRFTFLSYHSGISCFQASVNDTREAGLPITWENLEKYLNCKGGDDYVNGIFDNLYSFDSYLYQAGDLGTVFVAPTIIPTRTPVPTPTVYISTSVVRVKVYIDRNGNGSPDQNEWIDGMSVRLIVDNKQEINLRTENGVAVFDMNGYRPGAGIVVSLPGLYRSESFLLPEQGDVDVTFKFDQPALPTIIP